MSFLPIDMNQIVEILPQVAILLSQYHGCWYADDVRTQGINNHDIDIVKLRKLGPHTLDDDLLPIQHIIIWCSCNADILSIRPYEQT